MATNRNGKAGAGSLCGHDAQRLIEGAERQDFDRARQVIDAALAEAERQWIPLGATAQALAFALGELTSRAGRAAEMAAALELAAAQLRAQPRQPGPH